MVHQSVGRNQKPKGLKVKHVFQGTLLLVICIWFLYEITNSHFKSLEKKLKNGGTDLGRKGNAGSNELVEMDMHDGNIIIKDRDEDDVNGNVEVDKIAEGVEEDSSKHEDQHEGKFKEDGELENVSKKTLGNELNNGDAVESDQDENGQNAEENSTDDEQKDEKNDPKELQSVLGNTTEVLALEKDKESKYNAEETGMVSPETESSGVNGFQDENGIPPDGHEHEVFSSNKTRSGTLSIVMDEVVTRSSDNRTELDNNIVTKAGEFATQTNRQNDSEMSRADFHGKMTIGSDGRKKTSVNRSSNNSSQAKEDSRPEIADKVNKSESKQEMSTI